MTPSPPILHVETGRHLYGGALQVLYLLEGLRCRGVESLLVSPPGSAVAGAARQRGLEVAELPAGGDLDALFVLRLQRLIRRRRPALIHLHSRRGADLWGGVAARVTGVPAILTRRVDNLEPRPLVALKYRLYRRVIAISHGIESVLLSEGVARERLRCVPSAVDTERFRPGCDEAWFRTEFALEADRIPVGVIAQLIPRKGHRLLLEALPAIVEAHPRVLFLLFGRGPLEAELRDAIRRRGLETHCRLAGFREEIDRVLPCLRLVVHPASMEGLGVSLLQAAACGVPLVGCRAGGIPEIVREGESGRLVPVGDASALAGAVIDLLGDPEGAAGLGRAGRALVERQFSIRAMVEGNLAVYRELLPDL